MTKKCNCTTYYLHGRKPMCLHELFQSHLVKIMTKEVEYNGEIRFYIYRDKPKEKSVAWKKKWWRSGMRTRLTDRAEIMLAIELSDKHQVRRIKL